MFDQCLPQHVVILGGSGNLADAIKQRLVDFGVAVTTLGSGQKNDIYCDLLDPESIRGAVKKLDVFDGLVLNSKRDVVKPIQYREYEELTAAFQVGVSGPIYFIGQSLRGQKLLKGSSIVSLGSQSQLSGLRLSVDYASSKSAFHGMNKSLIKEFSNKKIRANSVIFDWIDDGKLPTDAERIGASDVSAFATPHQAAFPVTFLLSSRSRWISGQSLLFDGGRFLSRL